MGHGQTISAGSIATDRARGEQPIATALRAAFRIRHPGDLHERASDWGVRLPLGVRRRERLETVRRRGILFVHVPKNAGTSIATLLYGRKMRHETIRYYRHVARGLDVPSFAIWRDPVERFCSAFDFVRHGGGRDVRLAAASAARYARLRTLDEALTHLERARSPYEMDYVFRPQAWFLCDSRGRLAVDRLFSLSGIATLPQRIEALHGHAIPHLNDGARGTHVLTPPLRARIERLYASDVELGSYVE